MVTLMEIVTNFINQSGLQQKDVEMQENAVHETTQHKVGSTKEPHAGVTSKGHESSMIQVVSAKIKTAREARMRALTIVRSNI